MRKLVFCVFALILPVLSLLGTNYYSGNAGVLNNLNTWWTNRDGTGDHPPTFLNSNQVFYVQSGQDKTASSTWAVRGTNSKVVIETGGEITTGSYNHDIELDMQSGATYEMTYTTYTSLTPLSWDANSTFVFNRSGAGFQDDISYGNLTVRAGTADVFGSAGLTVRGTLTVEGSGVFEGGQTNDHTNTIANISVTGGSFYGSTSSGVITYNISGGISVSGSAYFYGSDGSGGVIYNVAGDVTVSTYAWFYACYRAGSLELPYVSYNIAGSFLCEGNNYIARNRELGGTPTFTFTGTGKSLGFGSATSTASCQHNIYINAGATYTLTRDLYGGNSAYLRINGSLDAGNYQIRNYGGYDPALHIYGMLKTERATGLVGNSTDAVSFNSPTNLYQYNSSVINYSASTAQTISPLSGYYGVTLSGTGTKTLSGSGCTVQNILNVNAPLVISSGSTIQLNGAITSTSTITGGNIMVTGTSSQFELPAATLDYFTLNRANGCLMKGNVTVTNMQLTNGTMNIGTNLLTINGNISYSSGLLSGTVSGSRLTIAGTADLFGLHAISLNTLTLNRSNGCVQAGNVTINTLNLTSGTYNISSYTLQLNGTLNISGGTLSSSTSSTLALGGSQNIVLPALTVGSLTLSRNGYICTMGGNLSVNSLALNSGEFRISGYILAISTSFTRTNGTLVGSSSATLVYNSSTQALSLPEITLYQFTLNSSQGCSLLGTMQTTNLTLTNGTLDLQSYVLYLQGSVAYSTGTITGSSSSYLNLNVFSGASLVLPKTTVGTLINSGTSTVSFSATSRVLTRLQLMNGDVTPGTYLSLATACVIERYSGALTAAPVFEGTVSVIYARSVHTGYEIPSSHGTLSSLRILFNYTVESDQDIWLNQSLVLDTRAVLLMDEGTLHLPAGITVVNGQYSLVLGPVQTSIPSGGFTLLPGGIGVGSGVEILAFGSSQSQVVQELQNGSSISRSWSLSGSFNGTATLTFSWSSSADNGLGFSPLNRACVMRRVGETWVRVGDFADVSISDPRTITVQTDGFSEWTIGSETSTLPVTLSSFTAAPNQMNYVLLNWTTQSESSLVGFRLLRSEMQNLAGALDLNVMVPATNTSTLQNYSYTDSEVTPPAQYYYWLAAVEMNGTTVYSDPVMVQLQNNGGPDAPPVVGLPLISAYPNPFNPILNLSVSHREDGWLRLEVFNQRGQKVRLLREGNLAKGLYYMEWNGLDDADRQCGSGIYLLRCSTAYEKVWTRVSLQK